MDNCINTDNSKCCTQNAEWTINCNQRIGYAYVPVQNSVFTNIYGAETGLERGTVFPYLDIPLGVYGYQFPKKENV